MAGSIKAKTLGSFYQLAILLASISLILKELRNKFELKKRPGTHELLAPIYGSASP